MTTETVALGPHYMAGRAHERHSSRLASGTHFAQNKPMRLRAIGVLTIGAALTATGCIAGALPPSRSDVGTTMTHADGEVATGVRVATGAHWASGSLDREQDYDIGVGYIYENASESGGDIRDEPGDGTDALVSHGVYASFATLLSRDIREDDRTWFGLRSEYLRASDGSNSIGVLARGTWEIFGASEGGGGFSDNCGGGAGYAMGTTALGLYLEAGPRRTFNNEASVSATAGVSLRLPFLFGFAYNLCPD